MVVGKGRRENHRLDINLEIWYTPMSMITAWMDEEYLMKCVVDPLKKTFYLYSNEGDTKEVVCDNTEQFMNVLKLVRAMCPEERLTYTEPITSGEASI